MILGFVTKTGASPTFFSQSAGNVGDGGGVGYIARKPDGTNMGTYQSAAQARNAFETMVGRERFVRWDRADLNGDIESYVAIGTPLTPAEIWGDDLQVWFEPEFALGSAQVSSSVTNKVPLVNSLTDNGGLLRQATVANQPVLVNPTAGFLDRATLLFDGVSDFTLESTAVAALAVPFTLIVVTNYNGVAGIDRHAIEGSVGTVTVGVDAAADYQYDNGGVVITGPAAGSAVAILSVKQDDAASGPGARFRVNGVQVGSNATTLAGGSAFTVSSASRFWPGNVAMVVVAAGADADDVRVIQTERWARERFQ